MTFFDLSIYHFYPFDVDPRRKSHHLGFLGFAYWQLITGMALGAVAGSWVGTQLRDYVPERIFRLGAKALITILCARMILKATGFTQVP